MCVMRYNHWACGCSGKKDYLGVIRCQPWKDRAALILTRISLDDPAITALTVKCEEESITNYAYQDRLCIDCVRKQEKREDELAKAKWGT